MRFLSSPNSCNLDASVIFSVLKASNSFLVMRSYMRRNHLEFNIEFNKQSDKFFNLQLRSVGWRLTEIGSLHFLSLTFDCSTEFARSVIACVCLRVRFRFCPNWIPAFGVVLIFADTWNNTKKSKHAFLNKSFRIIFQKNVYFFWLSLWNSFHSFKFVGDFLKWIFFLIYLSNKKKCFY